MTTHTRPDSTARIPLARDSGLRLGKIAGTLALTHVVLILAGVTITQPPLMADRVEGIRQDYAEASLARIFAGGYLETIGFLLLIPVLVHLARDLGRTTEVGRWAAQTALAAGIAYVAITIAVGFPAGAASAYAAHDGGDLEVALVFNDLRVFAYLLSLAVLGVHAIAIGVSALQSDFGRRWIGWGGVLTGLLLLGAAPLAVWNAHDLVTLVWMAWWIGLGVLLLRRPA